MPRCWLGLGGNQGDVPATFAAVADRIRGRWDSTPIISRYYRTAAMGASAGDRFWNAVAGFMTTESARDVLGQMQQWERELGRVRTVPWGPRTIDLDLLYYGDELIAEPDLVVPHPGAWYRRFVLDPLAAVAPGFLHPEWRQTVLQLQDRLRSPVLRLWCADDELGTSILRGVHRKQPQVLVSRWKAADPLQTGLLVAIGNAPAGWAGEPHLALGVGGDLSQQVIDLCTAAFEVPEPI